MLYNENGEEKQKISLKGSITGESSEIMKLEEWQLEYGDYISLYASDLDEENNTTTITPPQQSPDENPSERNISIINENSSLEGTEGTDGSSENDSNGIVEGNTPSTPEKRNYYKYDKNYRWSFKC